MSYQVLARKWRPQRFSQVVGQQHVLSALENGLNANRLHHAYLFSGTRGVGKTSIARLFAKGLNCETGMTADPCGQCDNCKAIEEGRFIDLIEIDAASRTKVEDTRELLDNVQYKPTVGRFKVYLIDEVHMLSRHSFNALLKTLEEPPEYVKFLLATTDPQKLPITILSRCLQFHLRAIAPSQMEAHLAFILSQEHIPYEQMALAKLAKAAQGSLRDALSLTDQAIAMSNAHITLPIVSQMLGLIDDQLPIELLNALALADGEKMMAALNRVAEKGADWQQLLSDLAEQLHCVAMLQLLPQHAGEESPLHFLARQMPPEEVQFFYQLILTGKKELPFAPEPRTGVEMILLRALAFHPKNADKISSPAMTGQTALQTPPARPAPISQLKAQLTANRAAEPSVAPPAEPPVAPPAEPKVKPQQAVEKGEKRANAADSPALRALNALKQLGADTPASQKKKPELAPPARPATTQARLGAAPPAVVATPPASSPEEAYRWTWLNPELDYQDNAPKASEIKQAILQTHTPDVVRKTIELARQQDWWSDVVSRLSLGGISRQIALNSYVAQREGNQLQLVLKPNMANLATDSSHQALANALAEQGLSYQITLGESAAHQTPLEIRRAIFEQMTANAKQALLADERLQLLRDAFGAEMDEATIRAVVA